MNFFDGGRRYNSLSVFMRNKFDHRLQKIAVNAGFTCPNRDGSKSVGGCTYCDNNAFNPSYCDPRKDLHWQLTEGYDFLQKRYKRSGGFLAYFQPFSNTYADINYLRDLWTQALNIEWISGIVVSTRPDCIDEEKMALLAEMNEKKHVFLELGIESVFDKTLQRINRGHSFADTCKAFELVAKYNIFVTGHYIIGMPGESREEILHSAEIMSALPMNALKIHQLQIIRDTAMHADFAVNTKEYDLFELSEYVDFVVSFAEKLNPNILIDRFAGEVPTRFLIEPQWGIIRYDQVLKLIENKFEERNTWQGRLI